MTNKEAIETIKIAMAEVEWDYPMDYTVAFEMAIDALEKQVQKKPTKTKIATLNKSPELLAGSKYIVVRDANLILLHNINTALNVG